VWQSQIKKEGEISQLWLHVTLVVPIIYKGIRLRDSFGDGLLIDAAFKMTESGYINMIC
jgi:hypothetical protein